MAPLSASFLVLLSACGGSSRNQADAGGDVATTGTLDGGESNGPDGGPWCPGPLEDAGFSSLANLPAASLCSGPEVDGVWESTLPCQGFTIVDIAVGVDSGGWWLFDASGNLVAEGSGGAGTTGPGCSGAVAGLKFPYQCFLNDGWPQHESLCPDAGSDAAASDAAHE